MRLVQADSLAETVDRVNEAFFFGRRVSKEQGLRAARFIARRHNLPGAYAGTFALFDAERRTGIRAFTGERLIAAAARHIIGEESCRALRFLNVGDAAVQHALDESSDRLRACVGVVRRRTSGHRKVPYLGGTYCCGRCSVSLWRHLNAGGMDDRERRLTVGLRFLRKMRKGNGGWRVFPFWYTLSALIEMEGKTAREELRYAAPVLEHSLRRSAGLEPFGPRRQEIARRALACA